jgi:D-cysteine desulfhydrase family pyridoxal phosphate-dependent enzyme
MNLDALPRFPLGLLPTPVQEMPALSGRLDCRLLIKRDDLTGLALGGNKIRKLEFLLGDAIRMGADTLVTTGAPQSNHCRQTAAAAAKAGLRSILVLAGSRQPADSGNLLLDSLLGAELVWTGGRPRDEVLRETFERERRGGGKPYLIPYGGSNPLGVAAYALAVRELIAQNVRPDWTVFASSSGGTQTGLLLGCALFGLNTRVYGISVDPTADVLRRIILDLAEKTRQALRLPASISADSICIDDGFLGAGYGKVGPNEKEAIALFARREGILLDPVYTGRAAGGLLKMIERGTIARGETVLFWHTGGTPALFAYADELTESAA